MHFLDKFGFAALCVVCSDWMSALLPVSAKKLASNMLSLENDFSAAMALSATDRSGIENGLFDYEWNRSHHQCGCNKSDVVKSILSRKSVDEVSAGLNIASIIKEASGKPQDEIDMSLLALAKSVRKKVAKKRPGISKKLAKKKSHGYRGTSQKTLSGESKKKGGGSRRRVRVNAGRKSKKSAIAKRIDGVWHDALEPSSKKPKKSGV